MLKKNTNTSPKSREAAAFTILLSFFLGFSSSSLSKAVMSEAEAYSVVLLTMTKSIIES